MATWDTIKAYQRAAFKPQAAQMDAIGFPASFGATSGSDGQQISNHNLSATVTDTNGVVWTRTEAMAIWNTVRKYALASWNTQYLDMDALEPVTVGTESGTDTGLAAAMSLSSQITDKNSVSWTATMTYTPGANPAFVFGLTNNGTAETPAVELQADPAGTDSTI